MRRSLIVGCVAVLFTWHCATACEKQPVHLSAEQITRRIAQRTPIVVQAHVARISGTVELLVEVDTQGKSSCVSILRGHPILTSAAVLSVKEWRFRPYHTKEKLVAYSGPLVIYAKDFTDGYTQQ